VVTYLAVFRKLPLIPGNYKFNTQMGTLLSRILLSLLNFLRPTQFRFPTIALFAAFHTKFVYLATRALRRMSRVKGDKGERVEKVETTEK